MALNFDDKPAIDAMTLSGGRFVFRYYDGQDQRVVALEFDEDFRTLGEVRAPVPRVDRRRGVLPAVLRTLEGTRPDARDGFGPGKESGVAYENLTFETEGPSPS